MRINKWFLQFGVVTWLTFLYSSTGYSNLCNTSLIVVGRNKNEISQFEHDLNTLLGRPLSSPLELSLLLSKTLSAREKLRFEKGITKLTGVSFEKALEAEKEGIIGYTAVNAELKLELSELLNKYGNLINRLGEPKANTPKRILGFVHQAQAFPHSILSQNDLISKWMSPTNLDENLYAFFGFHQDGMIDKHFRMRTWSPSRVADISAKDIVGMTPEEFVAILRFSMEVEAPIASYSLSSGNGLGFISPELARFMGKTEAQQQFAKENGLAWCSSSWCAEEDRHADAFLRMIERISGWKPDLVIDTNPDPEINSIEAAISHLNKRMGVEWSATSAYFMLLSHTKPESELNHFLTNILRDEIKHYTIMSAFFMYLHGPQRFKQIQQMLKETSSLTKYQSQERSNGNAIFKNPVGVAEMLWAFKSTEKQMNDWLKTVPYSTLEKLFETPSKLPYLPEGPLSPEEMVRRLRIMDERERWRADKPLWPPKALEKEKRHTALVTRLQPALDSTIALEFKDWRGAESPESGISKNYIMRIEELPLPKGLIPEIAASDAERTWRLALFESLRHYQIMNNNYIRNRKPEDLRPLK